MQRIGTYAQMAEDGDKRGRHVIVLDWIGRIANELM